MAEPHQSGGRVYVAATVFGIPAVTAKGELTIMAAGSAHAIATLQPLLDALGRKTWYLGDGPRHANIAKNSYEPGFKLTMGVKDVGLVPDAAQAKHAVLPAAEIVRENMDQAVARGWGDKDWPALAQATRRRAGLKEQIERRSVAIAASIHPWESAPVRTSRRGHFWIPGERVIVGGRHSSAGRCSWNGKRRSA